jgi:hypothetical protein
VKAIHVATPRRSSLMHAPPSSPAGSRSRRRASAHSPPTSSDQRRRGGRVWTQDQIDAALAALAGLIALEGHHCSVGDPAEGVILLPVSGPPPWLTRSGTTPSRARCLPAVDPTGPSRYHGPPLGGLAGGPVAPPGREPRT